MAPVRCLLPRGQQGSALVLSFIVIVMFSAMAVAMATMSGSNVQMAEVPAGFVPEIVIQYDPSAYSEVIL